MWRDFSIEPSIGKGAHFRICLLASVCLQPLFSSIAPSGYESHSSRACAPSIHSTHRTRPPNKTTKKTQFVTKPKRNTHYIGRTQYQLHSVSVFASVPISTVCVCNTGIRPVTPPNILAIVVVVILHFSFDFVCSDSVREHLILNPVSSSLELNYGKKTPNCNAQTNNAMWHFRYSTKCDNWDVTSLIIPCVHYGENMRILGQRIQRSIAEPGKPCRKSLPRQKCPETFRRVDVEKMVLFRIVGKKAMVSETRWHSRWHQIYRANGKMPCWGKKTAWTRNRDAETSKRIRFNIVYTHFGHIIFLDVRICDWCMYTFGRGDLAKCHNVGRMLKMAVHAYSLMPQSIAYSPLLSRYPPTPLSLYLFPIRFSLSPLSSPSPSPPSHSLSYSRWYILTNANVHVICWNSTRAKSIPSHIKRSAEWCSMCV